jgi:hypothetical protein
VIVKILGLDRAGNCVERAAESFGMWENAAGLRRICREHARRYLAEWPGVAAVDVRRDDDHKRIVRVVRTVPRIARKEPSR